MSYIDRDIAFDAALDEYQAREAELADERAEIGDREAARPGAVRFAVTFGDLVVGDYMTNEDGPDARWVEIVEVEPNRRKYHSEEDAPGWVVITFKTPQPLGVGYVDRWVIEREVATPVVVDQRARDGRADS